MALNIKDPETVALAAALAERLHTSKTGAIRHALHVQLAALDECTDAAFHHRADELMIFLRNEIWSGWPGDIRAGAAGIRYWHGGFHCRAHCSGASCISRLREGQASGGTQFR